MSLDPFKDFLKAQADATRTKQNLPVQRTVGAAPVKFGPQPGREQTSAEKAADFMSGGTTGKVINAIDRARLGDYSGALHQAGGAALNGAIFALTGEGTAAAKGVVKSAAAKFVGSLGKDAAMTMADLPERYAIMTAENPGGVMGAPAIAGGNSQLATDARALGKKVTPVLGAYTDDKTGQKLSENSLLIHNIGQSDAAALAAKHGQNSFVSQKGLHDIGSGKIFPSKGISEATGDTYTQLPGGQKFVHDLDWENPFEPQRAQSVDMVKQLMQGGPIFGAKDLEAAKAGDNLGHGTGPELPGAAADSAGKKVWMKLPAYRAKTGEVYTGQNFGDAHEKAMSYGHAEKDLTAGHRTWFGDKSHEFNPLDNPAADSAGVQAAKGLMAPSLNLPKPTKDVIGSAASVKLTPSQVKARSQAAWAAANAPVPPGQMARTPAGLIVDRSLVAPDAGPSTEPLPTRRAPGNSATGQVRGLNSDEQVALNQAFMKRGLAMKAPTFYSSYPAWAQALGNAGGDPDLWHQATTASAIQNGVNGELQNASGIIHAMNKGVTDAAEIAAADTKAKAAGIAHRIRNFYNANKPDGANKLFLTGGHIQALGNMLRGEPAGEAYKIPLYGDQKLGNAPGAVFDTHMTRTGTVFSPYSDYFAGNKGFSNVEYPYAEAANRQAASNLGLSDRAGQESQWSGGGTFSGLRSPPNEDYAQIAENQVLRHANLTGQRPSSALRAIATGNQALFTPSKGSNMPLLSVWGLPPQP